MRNKSAPSKKFSKPYRIVISNRLLNKLITSKEAMESSQTTHLRKLDVDEVYNDNFPTLQESMKQNDDENLQDSQKFFSQEDVHLLPTEWEEKRASKRDHLLKLAKESEDQDICPERNDPFSWEDQITKRTGLVFVRPYFNKLKDDWFIHWVKVSFPRNGETGGDCSYFKISQHELPELIELLSQLEKEISSQPRGKLIPRLANSKYSTFEDRNDVARFWAKDHCVYLKSGKLALRQHRNSENTYTIRMWSPREEKFGWHGPQISLHIGQTKQFISILHAFKKYIDNPQDLDTTASA
ncbi:uncharacterized protein LOC118435649 [Folsomia candida]|uniref:uncharacterized protein LOC118435649 n=1 Tax=Folsomia candida TaxID=158441 RepID=UPI001604FDC1|nr:uncharacterized protein LOC118435649 [Folsomia candida]